MSEERYRGEETDRVTALLKEFAVKGGADAERIPEGEMYLEKIRAFLEGQDFLKLGYALNGGQWDLALLRINKMKSRVKELGITCFDSGFMKIRGAAVRKNRAEALQILTGITAKRVALRSLLGKVYDV